MVTALALWLEAHKNLVIKEAYFGTVLVDIAIFITIYAITALYV